MRIASSVIVAPLALLLAGCPSRLGPDRGPSDTSAQVTQTVPALRNAQIFYVPWSRLTFMALKPDTVRQVAERSTVICDPKELQRFLEFIDLDDFQLPHGPSEVVGDFRVVVDLVWEDGTTETLAANRSRIVRLRDGASRPTDEFFRDYFESRHYDWVFANGH